MPSNFNQTLDVVNPTEGNFNPNAGRVDYQAVGQSVASAIDAFKPKPDDGSTALAQYASEAGDIVQATSGYTTERERLEQGIASTKPADREALLKYYDQLSSLRKGDMSPLTASARLNKLTKDHIILNPQLTLKFLAIKNGMLQDISAVAGASPQDIKNESDLKAIEELNATAQKNGRTTVEELGVRQAQTSAELSKMQFDALERTGKINEAGVADLYLSHMQVFYKELVPNVINDAKNPSFTGESILADLLGAKTQITLTTNKMLTDIQLKNKMVLSKEFQDGMLVKALAPLETMIELAKATDNPKARAALSENLRTISENADMEMLRKRLGPMVPLLRGTDGMIEWMTYMSENNDKIRHGLLPELRAQSKYDPKLALAIDFLTGEGFDEAMARGIDDVAHGREQAPSGNETIDKIRMQGGFNYALSATTPPAEQEAALSVLAGQPGSFEAWDERRDLAEKTKGMPKVVDALRRASPKQLVEYSSKSPEIDVSGLEFDALNKVSPFSIPYISRIPYSGATAQGSPLAPGAGSAFSSGQAAPATHELVLRLNQQYRVFSNYMSTPELMKWGATTLDALKATKTPGYEPTMGAGRAQGMLEPGNINLDTRVRVQNADGTTSTLKSISVNIDGKEVLIPTLSPSGKQLSDEDAITLYEYTGDHLGIFDTAANATAFAKKLSKMQGGEVAKPTPVDNKPVAKGKRFGRFSVDPDTAVVVDEKRHITLSPPAIERLLNSLQGEELNQLNSAVQYSYDSYVE